MSRYRVYLIICAASLMVAVWSCALQSPLKTARAQNPVARHSQLLAPYEDRLLTLDEERQWSEQLEEIPHGFQPWWMVPVERPLRDPAHVLTVQVETLVVGATQHSPHIRVMSDLPLIRRTTVAEATALFDTHAFVESKLISTNDPVGNTLSTGGPDRLVDQNWQVSSGLARRNTFGGQWELRQRFGWEESNSLYFIPNNQGTARLSLSYTQPLLSGSGKAYNQSIVMLAQLDARVAMDDFHRDMQAHLFEVTRAYWKLYLERVTYLQRLQLYEQAEVIASQLEARSTWDASDGQLLRARAAVARRRADLTVADSAVRSAEAQLISLVNDPELLQRAQSELIPIQRPYCCSHVPSLYDSALLALEHRPEVNKAMREIRAASIRAGVATKDLLPALNLVVAAYVSGLRGENNIAGAFEDQFAGGEPSYSVGLQFELPLGNRAALARRERQLLEVRRFSNQLHATVASLLSDTEQAVRDVDSAYREMQGRYHAMVAAGLEINRLTERWRLLPEDDRTAGLVLDNLLQAQERLSEAEYGFAAAQVNYNLSQNNLRRATGTLLEFEQLQIVEGCQNGLPVLQPGPMYFSPAAESFGPAVLPAPEPIALPAPEPVFSSRRNAGGTDAASIRR